MTADYLTVEEYQARRKVTDISTTQADLLEAWITAASRWVDNECIVDPGAFAVDGDEAATRYYDGSGRSEQWIPPHVTVSGLALSQDGGVSYSNLTENTDYWTNDGAEYGATPIRLLILMPTGGYDCFYKGRRTVKVIGKKGLSAAPPGPIVEATTIIVHEMVMRRSGQGEADRTMIAAGGFVIPGSAVPPAVYRMLAPYKESRL